LAGRIPQYERQVAAQADRRVISTPVLNQDVGEGDALRAVGGAIDAGVELAVKLEKANQDRQITTADRVAREKLDRLKFDLENTSPDMPDEDLKKSYQERSEALIQEAAKTIANPRARDVFTERAKGYQADGALWTDRLGLKRGVDRTRAGHVTAITEIDARAGDIAVKRETILEDIAGEKAALERARQMGVYTQEQAAELNAKLDGVAVKDNTMRFGANIDALVKDGRVAEARAAYQAQMGLNASEKLVDRVDPDVLAKISAGLEANEQESAVVERGDTIWTQSAGDYGKAIALAGEIKDAPLRLKVEARLNQKAAQAKAAEDARQDALENAMWAHVEGGGTIMSAPPSLRGDISPSRLGSIRAYENARDTESGMTAAQKAARDLESKIVKSSLDWLSRDNPSTFMNPDAWSAEYKAAYASMSSQDQLAVMNKIDEMKQTGVTSDAVDKVMQDAVKAAQRFAPSIMSGDKANADVKFRFEGILYENARKLSADRGGEPISPEDARRLVLRSMGEFDAKKYGEGVNMALGFDADVYRRVRDSLAARLGKEPSRQEVYAAYQTVMAD
jgi:hypothetical protein